MTKDDQINRFIATTGRMSRLVKHENDILGAAGRPAGLKERLAEKQALCAALEQQFKYLSDGEGLADIGAGPRRRLGDAIRTFEALLSENKARLSAKMVATTQVFQVIADAARAHRPGAPVYGRSGAVASPIRQAYTPALSVGMDREL